MTNESLTRMQTNLILYGLENHQYVIDVNRAYEHAHAIFSHLLYAYTETPSQYGYTYQGCWVSEDEFAADLASEVGILDSDWSIYFDYEMWTSDLFISDYTSLDCRKCGEVMIVRYQ